MLWRRQGSDLAVRLLPSLTSTILLRSAAPPAEVEAAGRDLGFEVEVVGANSLNTGHVCLLNTPVLPGETSYETSSMID